MDQDNYWGINLISFQVQAYSLYSFIFPGVAWLKVNGGGKGNLCHNLYIYYEEVIFIPLFYENYLIK